MPPSATSSTGLPPIKSSVLSPARKIHDDSTADSFTLTEGKQIHSYHKLFWRINATLEFNVFYHADRKLYEIAAYNSEKDHEFDPLFLLEEPVTKLVMAKDAINEEVEKIKVKLSKDRFNHTPEPEKLIEMAKINIFNKFVENHLQPTKEGTLTLTCLPSGEAETLIFIPPAPAPEPEETFSEVDANEENVDFENIDGNSTPVIFEAPPTAKPKPTSAKNRKTVVVRQRSTTMSEFNESLSLLRQDSKRLKQANQMTENLLKLSEVSVDAFKNALQFNAAHSSKYSKSTPLGRFRWAVHRVVLQTYVEAVRVRIDTLNANKKSIRINGTFPAPGSTDMQSERAKILSLAGRLNATPHMKHLSDTLSRDGTPRKLSVVEHSVSLPQL